MLFIHQSRPISVSWTIRPIKGHSPLSESPALKVLLWDGAHRYLVNPTMAEGNTLSFAIPGDMNTATYGLYVIWIDRLRPGAFSLNGKGFQDMVMRSMVRDAFALVQDPTNESDIIRTVLPATTTPARLTLTSHAHPFGPDGLDAYEIAVLRGNGDDEALWLERLQEALLNIASLPADYITGDANADGNADSNDAAYVDNLYSQNTFGILRPGDHLHAALTKLDAFAVANHSLILSNNAALKQADAALQQAISNLSDKTDLADSSLKQADAALQQSLSDLSDKTDLADAALQQSISDLSNKTDLADSSLQAQISGETQTSTSTTTVTPNNIGGFIPKDNTINVGESKKLDSTTDPGMVGSKYIDGRLWPIELKEGATITCSDSQWVICQWQSVNGSNSPVSADDVVKGLSTGTYTAAQDCHILLFDPDGKPLESGEENFTITSRTKSLTTRIKELEALVAAQSAQIASLQTAMSNISYTISADDDQDPTTE